MIAIIDYGIVNCASVGNALDKLGIPYLITKKPGDLKKAKAILLPGVGAAGRGMENLKKYGFDKVIIQEVTNGKPILGICLGMQLLLSSSEEGNVKGLGLVDGKVKKFKTKLKIPEIGWNNVLVQQKKSKLLKNIPDNSYFYFVNSYYCDPVDKGIVNGQTDYDGNFCSVFEYKNIYGAQFHPEKSGDVGLQLLKNYWEEACR